MKTINWNNEKVLAITTTIEMGNLAFQVGSKDEVIENRNNLSSFLNIPLDNIVLTHQSHSDILKEVSLNDLGRGKDSFESGIDADALYTKARNIAIGVFHADCVPLFLYHPAGLVMIIHAGFIGTLKHITYKAIKEVSEKENINPFEFVAYIGPSRKLNSYRISEEEYQDIKLNKCELATLIKEDEKYFDMALSNILDLIKAGVKLENINNSQIDTVTDDRCFSAYKKTPVGRMVSLIKLI